MTTYAFRLYVAGGTARSEAAESNLRFLCESRLQGDYEIDVVDTMGQPELAERERIIATPTVVRLAPSPELRVIGDLSDHDRAAAYLGLPRRGEMPSRRRSS